MPNKPKKPSHLLGLRPGEVECPVCHRAAWPLAPAHDRFPERGPAYRHERTTVLCRLTKLGEGTK